MARDMVSSFILCPPRSFTSLAIRTQSPTVRCSPATAVWLPGGQCRHRWGRFSRPAGVPTCCELLSHVKVPLMFNAVDPSKALFVPGRS